MPIPRPALLVMDVQNALVARLGEEAEALLTTTARAASAARDAGLAVVYVRIAFRRGAPEVSPASSMYAAIAGGGFSLDDESTAIHPAVAPREGDVVVVKKRVSAFAGSDLEVVLRSIDARSLVLAGIATSGVVLSTLRQAADLDYGLTVLRDCCADPDPVVHEVLLERVFPRHAQVMTTDDWVASLGIGPGTDP